MHAALTGIKDNASDGGYGSNDHDADVEDHEGPVEPQLPTSGLAQEDVHSQGQDEINGGDPQSPDQSCRQALMISHSFICSFIILQCLSEPTTTNRM